MVSVAAVKLPAVSQVRRGAQVASHLELAMDSYPPIYQMEPLPSFVFPTTKIALTRMKVTVACRQKSVARSSGPRRHLPGRK
jgi:hypothetical protein